MYPTNRQIADTISPTARIITAVCYLALGVILPGWWGYGLLAAGLGNAGAAAGQWIEYNDLVQE